MTKTEHEILSNLIEDVENNDDKIDTLERLYFTVKKMIKSNCNLKSCDTKN